MYNGYIIDAFQKGGAKIDPMFFRGLSETSVNDIKTSESFLSKDSLKRPIIDKSLESTSDVPKLYQGYTGKRVCTLVLDLGDAKKMIDKMNDDIINLKIKLKNFVNACKDGREKDIGRLKEIITRDKPESFHEYIDNLERLVSEVKKELKTIDTTFESNVLKLTKSYNIDKSGVYPKSGNVNLDVTMIDISPLKQKNMKEIADGKFENIKGSYISADKKMCNVINVDIGREIVKVSCEGKDIKIPFKNLCIEEQTTSKPIHTPPTTPPPKPIIPQPITPTTTATTTTTPTSIQELPPPTTKAPSPPLPPR